MDFSINYTYHKLQHCNYWLASLKILSISEISSLAADVVRENLLESKLFILKHIALLRAKQRIKWNDHLFPKLFCHFNLMPLVLHKNQDSVFFLLPGTLKSVAKMCYPFLCRRKHWDFHEKVRNNLLVRLKTWTETESYVEEQSALSRSPHMRELLPKRTL